MRSSTIRLLDVTIDNVTMAEAMSRTRDMMKEHRFHHVVTPGPEFLLEATANEKFRRILNAADLSLADGMGLHIGSRMSGQRLLQRIPGADYVIHVLQLAAEEGWRVFLYGGRPSIAERATAELLQRFPKLLIVGYESEDRLHWKRQSRRQVIERIHAAKPDIVLVALGAPKQELWIYDHRHDLHDVRLAVGVGRTFDYLAGAITRAPRLIRQSGFEWLYTFLTAGRYYQPQFRRRRVTNATYHFVLEMMKHRYAKRT